MRRRSALVALAAMLLHALAPLLANASPQAAPDHVELCTALGVVTVPVDSDGAPARAPAAPEHCPICAFQTVVAAVTATAHAPLAASANAIAVERPQPLGCSAPLGARPRAPPRHS
jgi:hypothetical protein